MEVLQDQTFIIRGKRSKRSRLSNSPPTLTVDSSSSSTTGEEQDMDQFTISSPNSQYSPPPPPSEEEQDMAMANCLILLAQGQTRDLRTHQTVMGFRCRTCDRCFPSFQALGGHRASHKKPKPTPLEISPAAISVRVAHDHHDQLVMLENDRTALTLQIPHSLIVKSKVHECSVCGAEFSSGQALGGHMRRHRPIASAIVTSTLPSAVEQITDNSQTRRNLHYLDLNLPAPEDDCRDLSNFPFSSSGGNVIVFSAGSAMVDCHY